MRSALAIVLALAATGCDEQSMVKQKRYNTFAPVKLWENGAEAQHPPRGTVAQGDLARDTASSAPPLVTQAVMNRGREQYEIFCSPCHNRSGDGRGIVVQRGFPPPPPLTSEKLLSASAQSLFDVITHGYGVMFPFASRIEPADRWAIVAYLRALQMSQHSRLADLPDVKGKLP